jgi:general L-amino acid transport system permease protein
MGTSELATFGPIEKPPQTSVEVIGWLRKNLFSSWLNGLLTLVVGVALYSVGRSLLAWVFSEANWKVVSSNLEILIWGRYPQDQVWRLAVSLAVILVLALASWLARRWRPPKRRWILFAWLASPFWLVVLLRGLILPTPLTVTNHLGYYLFRPELLSVLGVEWRGHGAVLLVGILGGLSWGAASTLRRVAIGSASFATLGLLAPYGVLQKEFLPGILLPNFVTIGLLFGVAWVVGRSAYRWLANAIAIPRLLLPAWLLLLPTLIILLTNFDVGVERVAPVAVLPIVQPAIWSGILLTVVLAAVSILGSFPIGVLLALGRRSSLPVVKGFCVLLIEVIRGVPLITILFMAQVMLPLFLPTELTLDRVLRAMAGMTLFTAAYLAEIVRGGLQAIRREQYEAARALGLSEALVTGLVILPQALRTVIPPIMGQFVSIFKDTTLVTIVGLLDLLAVAQSVIKQREFLGLVREVYLFAALIYFVISFAMSRASRRIEARQGIHRTANLGAE